MRILLFILCLCLPHIAGAACGGKDLRPNLSGEHQQELNAALAQMPYASGNHWLAEKDGRSLHIIGTLHVPDARFDAILDGLRPIVQNADLLLLEATKAEEDALQSALATRPELAFITQGPTLLDRMTPDDWARIAAAAQARGIPPFMASKFQPWFLSLTLNIPVCTLQSMGEGQQGLDHQLRDIADQAGVPMQALEPYDTLFRLAAQDSIEEQVKWLRLSTLSETAVENGLFTLTQQYFEQDHGAVIPLARIAGRAEVDVPEAEFNAAFDDAMAGLLDARNRAWIPVINAAQGQRIVVAMGAAHLAGEAGVLNLLAQDGYVLTRQAF